MPELFSETVKLGDLPIEQKEQISDSIIYTAEHSGEFYTEVNHVKLDDNKTSMTFVRSYLPKIDKTSERYKNGLIEGVTPAPETMNEAEFSVAVTENGWWFSITDKALNHAWQPLKERCTKFLGNIFSTYHDEKIADAYLTSANRVTSINLLNYEDLLGLHTILYKNGAMEFDGFYKLRVAPEVADKMLVQYKDLFTHTTQKENVVHGEIGELAGFRIIKSKLQAFAGKSAGEGNYNYPFVAYGKTMKGEYPVSICAYDDMAQSIIYTAPGGLGNDPLKQRGSIGLKVDGHGFYVFDDSVCVVGTATIAKEPVAVFNDANRSNLARTGTAGSDLFPNVTTVGLAAGGAWTLIVKNGAGTAVTTNCNYSTSNAAIATVSTAGVITAVKSGACTITIESKASKKVTTVDVIVA